MQLEFKQPKEQEFEQIKNYIAVFELDNRQLQAHEFIVATHQHQVFGFGRIRHHSDCLELCSLGVIKPQRRKGIGKNIVKELITARNNDVYLVCIIPDFFTPFGFEITNTYPESIAEKLNYCIQYLNVAETYVVMRLACLK